MERWNIYKEVYENDELVERTINGVKQNLDAIEGGGSEQAANDNDVQRKKNKKNRIAPIVQVTTLLTKSTNITHLVTFVSQIEYY